MRTSEISHAETDRTVGGIEADQHLHRRHHQFHILAEHIHRARRGWRSVHQKLNAYLPLGFKWQRDGRTDTRLIPGIGIAGWRHKLNGGQALPGRRQWIGIHLRDVEIAADKSVFERSAVAYCKRNRVISGQEECRNIVVELQEMIALMQLRYGSLASHLVAMPGRIFDANEQDDPPAGGMLPKFIGIHGQVQLSKQTLVWR